VLRVLLDENIDGYADYLSRHLFSPTWNDISSSLRLNISTFEQVGLAKGTPDEQIWHFCQDQQLYLLTDNRNDDKPGSLESIIRTRNLPTSLPVFTISDIPRLRTEREYVAALVAKLLEYLIDADNLRGVGRLYLP
jgi:hypothetical protein